MHRNAAFLLFLFLLASSVFGQSKPETVEFIIREMKSCENEALEVKDKSKF